VWESCFDAPAMRYAFGAHDLPGDWLEFRGGYGMLPIPVARRAVEILSARERAALG
jgi:hypothetical protein